MLHVTRSLLMDLILPKASLSIIDCLLKPPLAHFYKTHPVYRLQRHDQAATSPLRSDPSLEWPAKHNHNTPFSRWPLSQFQPAALHEAYILKLLLTAVYCYRWSSLECNSKLGLLLSERRKLLITSYHVFCESKPLQMRFLRGMMFILRSCSHWITKIKLAIISHYCKRRQFTRNGRTSFQN
jgi:hypothetical protein